MNLNEGERYLKNRESTHVSSECRDVSSSIRKNFKVDYKKRKDGVMTKCISPVTSRNGIPVNHMI